MPTQPSQPESPKAGNKNKKLYHPPHLEVYGHIRDFTSTSGTGILTDNPGGDPTKSTLSMH
jgi:hypothetical protein